MLVVTRHQQIDRLLKRMTANHPVCVGVIRKGFRLRRKQPVVKRPPGPWFAMIGLCLFGVAAHIVILREISQFRNREVCSLLNEVLCIAKD